LNERPSARHARAILLHQDDQKPQFVWLEARLSLGGYQDPAFEKWPGSESHRSRIHINEAVDKSKRRMVESVQLWYDDRFYDNYRTPNKAIVAIEKLRPRMIPYHDWRGPMLVCGRVGLSHDPLRIRDVEMDDFHHAAEYLWWYEPQWS
jgi:hypothetical protein